MDDSLKLPWELTYCPAIRQYSSELTTFTVTTRKTGHTPIQHHEGDCVALTAKLRTFGVFAVGKRVLLFLAFLELSAFFLDQLLELNL